VSGKGVLTPAFCDQKMKGRMKIYPVFLLNVFIKKIQNKNIKNQANNQII